MVGISFYSEVYNCNQTKEGEMNMKKKILLGLVLILCCFTGCSSNSSKNRDDNNPPEIKMSDIDWSVKSGIIDDERKLTFSYKNNTDYTIAYIELTFTRKDMVLDDSNSDINIYQWSSNDMAKKTAKPNFDCVVVNSDDNVMSGDEDDTESTTEATTTTAVKKATTTTAKKVTTTVKKKDTQTSGIRPRIKKAIDRKNIVMLWRNFRKSKMII